MVIGYKIQRLRKAIKLTQTEFAKRTDVGLRFLRELEQGKPTIRIDKLNQVLDFLGYHLDIIKNDKDYYKYEEYKKFGYPVKFNRKLKEKIRKRDNYKCQVCGITQKEYKSKTNKHLSVHHIDYDRENCKENNLISICQKCHGRTKTNKQIWIDFFTSIVNSKKS